ncbi:CopD family protein [Psychrobacillus sp.]|uniref:copper resistance D family protein n=1 Tax=Psychrobacillus sp. TaxID=1871623 RepID=UPI0028BE912D|nr:CopD family protein [Psychrobacillus sp.]
MMMILSTISEALLYTCFALLMGSYIFSLIPTGFKPDVVVSRSTKHIAVIGIALFSFMPLINILTFLYADYGLSQSLQSVLLTFEVGKAWLFTFILTIILGLFIFFFDHKNSKAYSIVGCVLVFLLILGLAWTSHARAVYGWQGFITHVLHFAAVVIWVGLLLVASWFSKNKDNWLRFLSWFHLTAIGCFVIISITGLVLMSYTMELTDYPNTWMISYGQSLLIKHLLIIPLIGYAFINGILMKRKLRAHSDLDPRPWTKIEFVLILLIFAATAAMGQQSPPLNLASILNFEGISPLFGQFYTGPVNADITVQLAFQGYGLLLVGLAVIFLVLSILSFFRKMHPLFSFIMSVLAVISSYLGLMLSVQVI